MSHTKARGLSVSCNAQRVAVTLFRKISRGCSSLWLQECARAEDAAGIKMIPGNDREDKPALLDFGVFDFYTQQDFGLFL